MTNLGYYQCSPWPSEDGGPLRLQQSVKIKETKFELQLQLKPNEKLSCTSKDFFMCTMCVLGDPGEVFLLTNTFEMFGGTTTTAQVLCIDPITLQTRYSSPILPGGPFWPGGFAIHADGSIIVVYGRYIHKLSRQTCEILASLKLPSPEPHNSFVILDNGYIVLKNKSDSVSALLTVLTPDLQRVCDDIEHFEPCVARLSSIGTTLYVLGITTVCRYHWNHSTLVLDKNWSFNYVASTCQEYGWDAVIDIPNNNLWFMDNGRHDYVINMIEAGVNSTPNRLLRVSLTDSDDHDSVVISGIPHGCITNPPLIDTKRRIVVAYDSSNRYICAYKYQTDSNNKTSITQIWSKHNVGVASHMVFDERTGYCFINNYKYWQEYVELIDISTGEVIASLRTGGIYQGVVFPSIGWNNDIYWVTLGRLSRIFITTTTKTNEDSNWFNNMPLLSKSSNFLSISFKFGCLALAASLFGYSWYPPLSSPSPSPSSPPLSSPSLMNTLLGYDQGISNSCLFYFVDTAVPSRLFPGLVCQNNIFYFLRLLSLVLSLSREIVRS